MGTKKEPGAYNCYVNAEPDEPMFVLLGRDPMAGILVRLWVRLREDAGEEPAKLEEALHVAMMCDAWSISKGKGRKLEAAMESLQRMAMPASFR